MCVCVCVCLCVRARMRTCFPFLNSNIMEKHFVICDTEPKYLL